MASFLSTIGTLIVGKPARALAVEPIPVKVKSPERLANERAILEARRNILANMAELERKRGVKVSVEELIRKIIAGKPVS